ncbi:MAG: hypothetical protein ACE5D3_03680 [Candidatus Binatia bacterium]
MGKHDDKTDRDLLITLVEGFEWLKADVQDNKGDIERHEGRLASLEQWKWTLAGGLIVVGILVKVFL